MSDGTKIEWADATANYVNGCSVVSPGCTNCYAMRLAGTRMRSHPTRAGLTVDSKAGPVWTGEVRQNTAVLTQVLGWKRPRRIFWNAHGDPFHPNVPDDWIDQQFAVMALTPQHIHMVLTKRPDLMRSYFADDDVRARIDCEMDAVISERIDPLFRRSDDLRAIAPDLEESWPLPNVWLGTSVEDQARADERIPQLLATPAAVRFLSCEPLLGPVDLNFLPFEKSCDCEEHSPTISSLSGSVYCEGCCEGPESTNSPTLDWVIVGGESGPNARPMHPEWVRGLRDELTSAGVAFFFKQWGEYGPYGGEGGVAGAWLDPNGSFYQSPTNWPPGADEARVYTIRYGKKRAGNLLDGRQHLEFPNG